MSVDLQHGARVVAEVLGDLVDRPAEAQPGGRGVVAQRVAAEPDRELAHDADLELPGIHRCLDPAWADLTTRLRHPDTDIEARAVAAELIRTGHVAAVAGEDEARQAMADAWADASRLGQSLALVTATHARAQRVGEAIQAHRIAAGHLDTSRVPLGQDGQPIYAGDIVQARCNDTAAGVQNRQHWIVKAITLESVSLAATGDSSGLRKISYDYAAGHFHSGYASTAYGIQGETTDVSLVGPGVDASGLYVGLARGRHDNTALVVAGSEASARAQLVEAMQHQPIEETLEKNRAAARAELDRAALAALQSATAAASQRGA